MSLKAEIEARYKKQVAPVPEPSKAAAESTGAPLSPKCEDSICACADCGADVASSCPAHVSPPQPEQGADGIPRAATEDMEYIAIANSQDRAQGRLTRRSYLENGYGAYRLLLQDSMPAVPPEAINFTLARSINAEIQGNPMGIDLEGRALLGTHDSPDSVATAAVVMDLARKFKLQRAQAAQWAQQLWSAAGNDPAALVALSDEAFHARLARVPTDVLEAHSQMTWRVPMSSTSDKSMRVPVSPKMEKMFQEGDPALVPALDFNLGIIILKKHGYIDS